jgi:undecaprenyl pyrophosphate phosphatase UppP
MQREPDIRNRSAKVVAPTIAVAVIQLVATVVVAAMFTWDMWFAGTCEQCAPDAADAARAIVVGTLIGGWVATVAAILVGYRIARPLSWVPMISCVVIVGGYVIARILLYAGR